MQKKEGEKSEQILFWPPCFLPITDSLVCLNYEQQARERRVGCRRLQQWKWQQRTPAQRSGHGALLPHLLCCDRHPLSGSSVPSETRPLGRVAVSTLPGLPSHPCPPGVASEPQGTQTSSPRGLRPRFLELLNSRNLVSTPLPDSQLG